MTTIAYGSYEPQRPFVDVRQLFCADCGYGIVIRREPPDCPMCRGNSWSERPPAARLN